MPKGLRGLTSLADDVARGTPIKRALRQRGYKRIGAGQGGSVWADSPDGDVVKTWNDRGYSDFVDLVEREGGEAFPDFREMYDTRRPRALAMERLRHLDRSDEALWREANRYAHGWSKGEGLPDYLKDAIDQLNAHRRAKSYFERPEMDMNFNSIMKRDDGTYVITDPFYHAWSDPGFLAKIGSGAAGLGFLGKGLYDQYGDE